MKNPSQTLFPQDCYPIRLGWLKAMPMLVFAAIIAYVWIVVFKMTSHTTPRSIIKGSAATAVLLVVFNFIFYGIYAGDWKFLWHYLRQNIVAFEVWIFRPDGVPLQNSSISIRPRGAKLGEVLEHQYCKGWMVCYPLGGWFKRRGRVVHCNEGTDLEYAGRIRVLRLPGFDPLGHQLWVPDKWRTGKEPRVTMHIEVRRLFGLLDWFVEYGGIKWRTFADRYPEARGGESEGR